MKIFIEKKAIVERHNGRAMKGETPFFLKMNEFSDQVGSFVSCPWFPIISQNFLSTKLSYGSPSVLERIETVPPNLFFY